ncbi:MAG TPA: hypothetical protein VHK90_15120 [Thermoanaerobaculia bacterium]|nr:hypothetical protein [Thermoanaerobaculia bacterium]
MKAIRILLLLAGILSIASIAEAGCYQCQNLRPMPWYQGACVDGQIGVCSSQCCGQVFGTQCTLPDNDLWYCYDPPDQFARRYFAGPGLPQNTAVALARKAGTYESFRRDAAKRRIPRRCGASV